MKRNTALKGFIERFHGILDAFDALDADEEREELNAEFEDAIFLLECVNPEDAEADEEIEGALDEIDALCGDYHSVAGKDPDVLEIARQMEMASRMARQNLL